jgi:hypothetical protein
MIARSAMTTWSGLWLDTSPIAAWANCLILTDCKTHPASWNNPRVRFVLPTRGQRSGHSRHHDVSSHTSSIGREPSHCQSHQQPTLPTLSRATNARTCGSRILRFRQSADGLLKQAATPQLAAAPQAWGWTVLHITASGRHRHSPQPHNQTCAPCQSVCRQTLRGGDGGHSAARLPHHAQRRPWAET